MQRNNAWNPLRQQNNKKVQQLRKYLSDELYFACLRSMNNDLVDTIRDPIRDELRLTAF